MIDPILHLKEAIENLPENFQDIFVLVDEDSLWYEEDSEVSWNTDKNFLDLSLGDGNTYSGYATTGRHEYGRWVMFVLDTQQGYLQTVFFLKENEVEPTVGE